MANQFHLNHQVYKWIATIIFIINLTIVNANDTLNWQKKPVQSYTANDISSKLRSKNKECYAKKKYLDIIKNYGKAINDLQISSNILIASSLIKETKDSILSFYRKGYLGDLESHLFSLEHKIGQGLYLSRKFEESYEHFLELKSHLISSKIDSIEKARKIKNCNTYISEYYKELKRYYEYIALNKESLDMENPEPTMLARLSNNLLLLEEHEEAEQFANLSLNIIRKRIENDNSNIFINNCLLILYDYFCEVKDEVVMNEIVNSLKKRELDQREYFLINYKMAKYFIRSKQLDKAEPILKNLLKKELNDMDRSILLYLELINYYLKNNSLIEAENYLTKLFDLLKLDKGLKINSNNVRLKNLNHLIESLRYAVELNIAKFKKTENNKYLSFGVLYAEEIYNSIIFTRSKIRSDLDKKFSNVDFEKYYNILIKIAFLNNDFNLAWKYICFSKNYSLSFTRIFKEFQKRNQRLSENDSLAQLYKKVVAAEQQVINNPSSKSLSSDLHNLRDQYFKDYDIDEITNSLEKKLNSNNDLITTQSDLNENDCIISYYTIDSTFYSIYIEHDTIIHNMGILPKNFKEIINCIKDYNCPYENITRKLKPLLLPSQLKENVTIIPHGILNYLPFEVLKDENGKMLLNNHVIHYEYKLSDNIKLNKAIDSIAAIGPKFNESCSNFEKLVYNEEECAHSTKHFEVPYQNTEFITKDSFLIICHKYKILHFASHTVFDDQSPYKSFLALADRCDSENESYQLFIKDILAENLSNEMIVLSSCDSGNGKMIAGEGLESLSKAFFSANVKSVISTLWAANDKPTSKIMKYFYEYLSKGHAKDKALQKAKIKFLEKASTDHIHPFYWAGFIPYGDMRPITNKPFPFSYFILGCIGLGLIILINQKRKTSSKAA